MIHVINMIDTELTTKCNVLSLTLYVLLKALPPVCMKYTA